MEVLLVVGEANLPYFNESGEVLIHNVITGEDHFVRPTNEILNNFPRVQAYMETEHVGADMEGIDSADPNANVDPVDSVGTDLQIDSGMEINLNGTHGTESTKFKAYWTYELTIVLINKYKAYYPLFADAIHKNVQVWDMIAAEFRKEGFAFNATQCENRWKYIRAKYIKKKDNASKSNTGGEYYNFQYFDEIDEILGKKPNISPKFLVSSIQSLKNKENVGPSSTLIQSPPSKNKKNVGSASVVDLDSSSTDINMLFSDGGIFNDDEEEGACASNTPNSKSKSKKESSEDNAKRQDKYHNEMIEMQRESLTVFKDIMLKVLEEYKKN